MKAILGRGNLSEENIIIQIGGSKSESNRLLILQAIFPNISIKNLSDSDDTQVLQKALGCEKGTVDIHHAGTAMRFLTAYFAAKDGVEIILTGSQRMQERPIGILVHALRSLGGDIEYLNKPGFPPLKIKGKLLQKNKVSIKADVSSQYISALMLIAPMLPNGIEIVLEGNPTSQSYFRMTLSLLERLGIQGKYENNSIVISSIKEIPKSEVKVESDWSSASYFYSLVALSENFKMRLESFSERSLQGDSVLKDIYASLGVETIFNASDKNISLSKKKIELPDSLVLDLANTPDLAQTIAVTCFGLGIGCKLTGLETLKIKETDRLLALRNELRKLGANIQVNMNSLQLEKSSRIKAHQTIKTYQDHRMAMAFSPLALRTNLIIEDAEVVSKSYPNFWRDLKKTGISCQFEA